MGKNKRNKKSLYMICGILGSLFLCHLTACQVVEPEKRAYPQVIGADWKEKEQTYRVWMHLASLAGDTGQGKESDEIQPGNSLYFSGSTMEDIHAAYETTREQYLDIGHVKALIFGSELWNNKEILRQVLEKMESESSLGNSPYIFVTDQLSEVTETAEAQGISLGDFLTGIYENRTEDTGKEPVKLADLYRADHKKEGLPRIPVIRVKDQVLQIKNPSDDML